MPRGLAVHRIDFVPRKYGRELLVDVGWIHEWPTFVLDEKPHALAFYEVLLVTAGRGRVWIDVTEMRVQRGLLLFTAPGQLRRWRARGVDGVAVFFTASFIAEFFRDELFLHRLQFFSHPRTPPAVRLTSPEAAALRGRLTDMRSETESGRRDSPHVMRAMLYELLVRLNRRYARAHGLQDDTVVEPFVLRFKDLLDRHIARWHRVSDYASRLGVTPGHLNALARRHFGQSASSVIRATLLAEAKRRLAYTNLPAAAIAESLGFDDPSYFSRFVQREARISPARYRSEIRQKHQPAND
jgi:AraC family transcriptional regulator, transcriptional activator of pobA